MKSQQAMSDNNVYLEIQFKIKTCYDNFGGLGCCPLTYHWTQYRDRTTILTLTRDNCSSQNTHPLKRETLHSTVQTVPLNAVNPGINNTKNCIHHKTQNRRHFLPQELIL